MLESSLEVQEVLSAKEKDRILGEKQTSTVFIRWGGFENTQIK
jgi:hypothetical protein